MTSHMRMLKYCGKVYNIAPRPARNQKNFFAERETGDNENSMEGIFQRIPTAQAPS